jgi:hypothetical protein
VAHIRATFRLSERRACGLVGIAVSTFRYLRADTDERLRQQLIDLAREKPLYGYRRLRLPNTGRFCTLLGSAFLRSEIVAAQAARQGFPAAPPAALTVDLCR